MKKFLFALIVCLWAGTLILLSFSREVWNEKDHTVAIDLNEWARLAVWDEKEKTFLETDFSPEKRRSDAFYLHRLSPVDGIYYRSNSTEPFAVEKKEGRNIVTLGLGLYVCNIQTGLEKYEFRTNDMNLFPKGRGVFLVYNTQEQTEVFSFDTFLETELVNTPDRSHITGFTLFPSLLFKHNPENTTELKEADILRISVIDSIRYVDLKTVEDGKLLFSWREARKDQTFLSEVQKDITARIHAFTDLSLSFSSEQEGKKTEKASFFDASSPLLINGSKKEVLLKNTLIEDIRKLLSSPLETSSVVAINNTLSEMRQLSPKVYADGLSILRQYYYVTVFSRFRETEDFSNFSWKPSLFLSLVEKTLSPDTQLKQGEYYSHLSNLFSIYYFLVLKQEKFNSFFEKILSKIIDDKVLAKDEFLPFTFFVTQYLSLGPVIPNEDTMHIVSHLFQITNDYSLNNGSEESKLATITSTTFYNYNKIFSKIQNIFLDTFIDKTPDGFLLKKEYSENENAYLDQNFVDAFVKIVSTAKKDVENKKELLYSKNSFQWNSQVTDSYTLLKTTLDSFDILTSMFGNYPKYLNDFHLNESNKSARGILIKKGGEMSMKILEAYLSNFNNLDTSSLQVVNNFGKDGFYEIQVNILGNVFNFKLWEQNHILADISYTDTFGKKHVFPNITIPLDQKEEQLKELLSSSNDSLSQYKYDFRNFFEITFLKGDSLVSTNSSSATIPDNKMSSASPEIQLFIQKELLDKDFKNIESFLPIRFQNITASIKDGNYDIDLDNIDKIFLGESSSFPVVLRSKYIFNRHSFSRLTLKIKREDNNGYLFDGTPIEILPARISLLSLSESLKDIGYYLDTIQRVYKNQQSIVIDLTGKKALLDDIPFVPKFPSWSSDLGVN